MSFIWIGFDREISHKLIIESLKNEFIKELNVDKIIESVEYEI